MENCIIRWDNFSEHVKGVLYEMMKTTQMTDVTLVCDDKKKINAHKIVLAACSEVFKNFFKLNFCGFNLFKYQILNYWTIKNLLLPWVFYFNCRSFYNFASNRQSI